MPEMDGIETIQRIKTEDKLKDVKIIIVTAFGGESIAKKAEKLGVNGFISKPFTFSTMFDTIMEVFDKDARTRKVGTHKELKHKDELAKIKGAKILLAEDNEINQQVAAELLESAGFVIEIANDGLEAFEMVRNSGSPSKYSLVLMDLQMPNLDGFGSTRKIRELAEYDKLPILAMTADAMSGVKEKCIESGMMDYVTKPIDPDALFKALIDWIAPETIQKEVESKENANVPIPDEIEIPQMEGIDSKEGLIRVAGNKKLFIKILKSFYESNLTFIDDLKVTYKSGDKEATVRAAHTLKGVSGNIGAIELHKAAEKLEKDLNDEKIDDIEKRLVIFKDVLEPVMEAIRINLIDIKVSDEKQVDGEIDKDKIKALLEELKELLEDDDFDAAEKVDEIVEISGEFSKLEMTKIRKAVEDYEFDEALEITKKLIDNI
jgi:CheY-like chemotaxis protein